MQKTWISSYPRNGAIERISEQLQRELPGLRGFSGANLKFMRQFYESWADLILRQKENDSKSIAVATDLEKTDSIDVQLLLPVKRLPMAIDFAWDEFVGISFSHHMEILHKVTEVDERSFYIHQTYLNKWDKYRLRDLLKADLYHHQGQPNNFAKAIPTTKSAIKAIEMFKDETPSTIIQIRFVCTHL